MELRESSKRCFAALQRKDLQTALEETKKMRGSKITTDEIIHDRNKELLKTIFSSLRWSIEEIFCKSMAQKRSPTTMSYLMAGSLREELNERLASLEARQ